MKTGQQRLVSIFAVVLFGSFSLIVFSARTPLEAAVSAQTSPTPTPAAVFDQAAALAKLREQIKGREKEPASAVFKNIQLPMMKDRTAAQLLAVMEFGIARSLGVTCTHCHVPDKWES